MKRISSLLFALTASVAMMAQGWPANYGGVMLQAFYWNGYADSQWLRLEQQTDNLSKVFDLVWIPQSGNCGGQSMGYDDLYWFPGEGRYTCSFGTEAELRSMINTFKAKGIGTIADVVVNHRKELTNRVIFPAETYKGVTYQLKPNDVCSDDDGGSTKTWATQNGYTLGNPEQASEVFTSNTCEGWDGMRDLDHTSTNVQSNVKAYLHMLLEDLGYAGFRYDMTKGYPGKYTALYNKDAKPTYSVGEFWDGDPNNLIKWLNATKDNDAIQTAVFDFAFRYTVRNALRGSDNDNNSNNWKQAANMKLLSASSVASNDNYKRYSVTFVENHDTEYRDAKNQQDPIRKDTLAANAYLLAMPGTPCVFLTHWQAYKQEIANMVAVRKAVGITNVSTYVQMRSNTNYYAVQVTGSNGKLICIVGKDLTSYVPGSDQGWKKVISGYHYAYYVQGIEPSAITLPQLTDNTTPEASYGGVPSFCTVNDGEICAFFEAPVAWGAISHTWVWMNGKDGKEYLGVEWPGVNATLIGYADNGNKVFKWVSTKTTAPDNIIFSGAGGQMEDKSFVNGGYYTKDGLKATVSTGIQTMKADPDSPVRIYTIDGHLLRVLPVGTNTAEALNNLGHGLYLVNGKKVVK